MLIFALVLAAGYILYLVWEKWANDRYLAGFRHVIHVNGIRGKTGVCRLIDATLRGAGYKVFTKTTGSTPLIIDTAGQERPLRRWGPPNIHEQLRVIRQAHREGAEILILECMAVAPELQKAAQERIIRGDVNVITNVRYDHVYAMGGTLDEIAESLAGTIPKNGVLFTADEAYFDFFSRRCQALGSQAVLCRTEAPARDENEAIALAVGLHLGARAEDFRQSLEGYQEDFGANKRYTVHGRPFLNLFSANDPQSTRLLLDRCGGSGEDTTIVYNNRMDRPDRVELFAKYFFPGLNYRRVVVIGESRALACRLLRKGGVANVEAVRRWDDVFRPGETGPVVGVGNIKGEVYDILLKLEEEKRDE